MERMYKCFRLAYETKYWLNELAKYQNDKMLRNLQGKTTTDIEKDILQEYNLEGVSATLTLNVTTGSVIDLAVQQAKDVLTEEWNELAKEVEIAKREIKDVDMEDSTPKIYMLTQTYKELQRIQLQMKEDNHRVPKIAYIIKLAAYRLYKAISN